jgi:DNA-binding transcriptional ArsR family regulator
VQVCEALADDTRVRIVELLAHQDLSAGDIATNFAISRPAVSRHLRVLRDAGLTRVTRDAQRRVYSLDPSPLYELEQWLEDNRRSWAKRFDALGAHLDDMARTESTRGRPRKGRADDR